MTEMAEHHRDERSGPGSARIFILGDSRTGTTSLHDYFSQLGYRCLHYYVEAAGQTAPIHIDHDGNWRRLRSFLLSSECRVFSDYPTRSFYRELRNEFPESFFILSVRSSTDVWKKSLKQFLSKFGQDIDADELAINYERVNDDIRNLFRESPRFLEICVDDPSEKTELALANIFDPSRKARWRVSNAAREIDVSTLSGRRTVFPVETSQDSAEIIEGIESIIAPSKAVLGEYGWIFLANDSNDYLKYQFGVHTWSIAERDLVATMWTRRRLEIERLGGKYFKFIVPEKSAIYREFLPKAMHHLAEEKNPPSQVLEDIDPDRVQYLKKWMLDAKSYGQLYFRGDSHPNWLGSYFVYLAIHEHLSRRGLSAMSQVIPLSSMVPRVAEYDGDLFTQLKVEHRELIDAVWPLFKGSTAFERTISLRPSGLGTEYSEISECLPGTEDFSRPTRIYQHSNMSLPRAVIFRDSTCDFVHELLANHFSRSVFIWHEGQVISDIIESERPDVVLHIMADRFVSRYPSFLPTVSLAQTRRARG